MEPVKYEQSTYIIEALLKWCDTNKLNDLLRSINYPTGTSRLSCLGMFIERLNQEQTAEAQKTIIDTFNESIIEQVKDRRIRIIGLSYFATAPSSLDESLEDLLGQEGSETIAEYNFNNLFNFIPGDTSKVIYRQATLDQNQQKLIKLDLLFGRRYKKNVDDKLRVDFTWLTLDIENRKAIFYFQSMKDNYYAPDTPISPLINFGLISDYLLRKYRLQLHNENNTEQIFNIYRRLTTSNEVAYQDIVKNAAINKDGQSIVSVFYSEMINKLSSGRTINDNIHAEERIFNVFVRLLISNDFEEFKRFVSGRPGSVTAFIYNDLDGSSVNGKNGRGMYRSSKEIAPMESSTTYFDTKDTITNAKMLDSVDVVWKKYGLDYSTRYTAYSGFLAIHFIRVAVSEGVLNSVLQDFNQLAN